MKIPAFSALREHEIGRFVAFLVVGGLNSLVGYTLFAILITLGFETTLAVIGSTILGILFNFQSIGRMVFASGDARLLPRFVVVYLVQISINLGMLRILTGLGLSTLFAEALIFPPLAVLTYLMVRHFVFAATVLQRQNDAQ